MINDLLSHATASTSPFAQPKPEPSDEMLRHLASEIIRLTPTLAESLVASGKSKSTTSSGGRIEQPSTGR